MQRLKRYLQVIWLPLILVIIFVIQTWAFNYWFDITPGLYLYRLIIVSLSLGIALYGPSLLFRKHSRFIYLFIISFCISALFIAQFLYFSYAGAFLQISALAYAGLATTLTGTIFTLLTPKLFIFLINIVLLILALILISKKKYIEITLSKKEKIIAILIIILITVGGYWFVLRLEKKEWGSTSRLYTDVYDLNTLVGKLGIINFTFEDGLKYLLRSNKVTASDVDFLKQWSQGRINSTSTERYFGLAKNRNVIIIQIESMENAVINQQTNGQEITPNLNQLAKEGLYFDNFYAQVGPGNTADAEFAITNSLYPLPDDVAFVNYAHNDYDALPKLLNNNNYHTYALHGDVPTFWNRSSIYPGLGYQKMFSKNDYQESRVVGVGFAGLGDEDFFSQSLPRLEKLVQPFLATLITLSSHTPFELPKDLQTLTLPNPTNLNWLQQQYLESVHYTDKALGEFIYQLKQTNLYDNSIIIIYGDHQSYTDISDAIGYNKNIFPGLSNDGRVPLIILAPGTDLQGTTSTPASQIDLYPTIANLLGIVPPKSILGQDIFNTKTPVAVRRNVITGTINIILASNLAYKYSESGIYENGQCFELPSRKPLPIDNCRELYNQQQNTLRASDIVVRGNLLGLLK